MSSPVAVPISLALAFGVLAMHHEPHGAVVQLRGVGGLDVRVHARYARELRQLRGSTSPCPKSIPFPPEVIRRNGTSTFICGIPPTRRTSPARPKAVYSPRCTAATKPRPDIPALGSAVVELRGRDRARGRRDRPARPAVPRDRVLARHNQRSDRLRAHARADRRRRLRGRRALARQQHPGRRADRLHQQRQALGGAGVRLQRRAAATHAAPATVRKPERTVPLSMADRVRDISKVLDELPGWFGARADAEARA